MTLPVSSHEIAAHAEVTWTQPSGAAQSTRDTHRMTNEIRLGRTWRLHEQIGGGGVGRVFRATADGDICAAKLVAR
jgi:hypothetical protein